MIFATEEYVGLLFVMGFMGKLILGASVLKGDHHGTASGECMN
jgi:hypothetical protein